MQPIVRRTPQRQQILAALKSAGQALSARQLTERLPEVDRATIFRNLPVLAAAGLLQEVRIGDERYYEYIGQAEAHHHAVCDSCGEVLHFDIPAGDLRRWVPAHFQPDHIQVVVRGVCECSCH